MNVCGYCGKPIPAHAVSEWWCGINCQTAWHVDWAGPLNVYDVTSRPNYHAYQGDWSLDAWDAHTRRTTRSTTVTP